MRVVVVGGSGNVGTSLGLIFKREAASGIRRLFLGPLVPGAVLRPSNIPAVPRTRGLRLQAVHADDVAEAYRARNELGWVPERTAGEALIELLEGMAEGAGTDSPPLVPWGRERSRRAA